MFERVADMQDEFAAAADSQYYRSDEHLENELSVGRHCLDDLAVPFCACDPPWPAAVSPGEISVAAATVTCPLLRRGDFPCTEMLGDMTASPTAVTGFSCCLSSLSTPPSEAHDRSSLPSLRTPDDAVPLHDLQAGLLSGTVSALSALGCCGVVRRRGGFWRFFMIGEAVERTLSASLWASGSGMSSKERALHTGL